MIPGSPEHTRLQSKLKQLEITDLLSRVERLEDMMEDKADVTEMRNEIARLREMLGNLDADEKTTIEIRNQPTGSV